MTPNAARSIGSHRLRALLLGVVLVGSLVVPAVALAASGGPTVTIDQAAGQADPTNASPINFTVVFSTGVTGFATGDVTLSGTAGATTATVTGTGPTYNVAVTGMTTSGSVTATIAADVATATVGGLLNVASTSTDSTVTWDVTQPTVTINQAVAQVDPTGTSPINFTVVFSEPVSGFATGDVTLTTGSAGGTLVGTVTGSGTTYNVAVTGMTTGGAVIASIAAGMATDLAGNPNGASTSSDDTVFWAPGGPSVTINQAAGQADPTKTDPIDFTVVFSSIVTGFTTGEVTLTGTAGGTLVGTVTGSGTTYNVAVAGMTTSGTVIATIAAGVALDASSRPNVASTSTDNSVAWDVTQPTVTIDQATGQTDPTGIAPINFTVVFSESVTGFATGDVTLTGTAGGTLVGTVTGSGMTYNVAVTGMTTTGTVVASIGINKAVDATGNQNLASGSTDNSVTWAPGGPTVTINQATAQADPTGTSPINFTVVFSASVTGFATGDVSLTGTAGGTLVGAVTGSGTTYNVAVTGMTTGGTVIASIGGGIALDASSRPNLASTSSDNSVTWTTGPTVTINQAAGQADPTGTTPINFTVVFSASVTGFATGDVTLTGTAGGTLVGTVTGSGTTYNVAVTGMTSSGTVIATVPASAAADASSRPSSASTSTDNTVTWTPGQGVTINQAATQADPTATSPINFTVVFGAAVTGFATGDVTLTGTAGGTLVGTVTGSGTTYNVAVTGMTTSGTVIATIAAGVALDASSRSNLASTSTDNTVTWVPVASAITLTTSAPTPAGAKSPVIFWGQGFFLGVQFASNGAGKSVQLQGTRDGVAWTTITILTMDSAGHASYRYTPVTNLFYRAVFTGTADLSAGTSNTVRTVVRQIALLRPTNSGAIRTISRNTSITFTTTVRPSRPELAPANVTFVFYRQVGSTWTLVTKRDVMVGAAGLASTRYTFTTSGRWYVRSIANPTPYNANSVWSPVERYTVN